MAVIYDCVLGKLRRCDKGPGSPEYDSGWVAINQATEKILTHNLGGNSDNYLIEVFIKDFILFEDNFTGGIKSEWVVLTGPWEHNSELDAYQITYDLKGKTKVDITTPDDVLVEYKIIGVSTEQNTYFDLMTRYDWSNNNGYSIAYVEVYSRLYDLALILSPWTNNSRGAGLDYVTWTELGLSGVAELEGKTIGIKCEGNVIKGYLDGEEILSATDNTHSSGQTGIIASSKAGTDIFDDFKIKKTEGGYELFNDSFKLNTINIKIDTSNYSNKHIRVRIWKCV